ncbi:hypothetical protein NUW54_g9881 [Trametes sanguinea]|uniref:Uncharacterized protein n=1 Tax=Trametes sanguinea TaxID=158606 RepID=A0ACC1P5N5_9APHY|nr:hypothetical protein NUW54_g9881 [Trametes sanguinea]
MYDFSSGWTARPRAVSSAQRTGASSSTRSRSPAISIQPWLLPAGWFSKVQFIAHTSYPASKAAVAAVQAYSKATRVTSLPPSRDSRMTSESSLRDRKAAGSSAKRMASRIALTAFAAFGGVLFGYDTGTIQGLLEMRDWLRTFGEPDSSASTGFSLPTSRESLIVSILSAGTFIGGCPRRCTDC